MLRGPGRLHYRPPKRTTPMESNDLHKLIDWHLTVSDRPHNEQLHSWHTIFRLVLHFRSIIRYHDTMRHEM